MNEKVQTAIVTGAGSGIGRAIAVALAKRGVTIALFDIDLENAQATESEISSSGGRAVAKQLDVSNETSVKEAVDWVAQTLGQPSMLCNSAAIQRFSRSDSFAYEDWKQVIDINLNGSFLMCQALLPHIETTKGSIVNIASLAGNIGIPYSAAYSASKGGVIAMTKALAKEYSDRDVRINVITPGAVDTPMLAMDIPEGINPKVLSVIPRSARAAASPDEIAKLVVFLLTEAPGAMTGAVIPIDAASS